MLPSSPFLFYFFHRHPLFPLLNISSLTLVFSSPPLLYVSSDTLSLFTSPLCRSDFSSSKPFFLSTTFLFLSKTTLPLLFSILMSLCPAIYRVVSIYQSCFKLIPIGCLYFQTQREVSRTYERKSIYQRCVRPHKSPTSPGTDAFQSIQITQGFDLNWSRS